MAVIESEFGLSEMQSKGVFCNLMELRQSVLGVAPKRFNSVNMFSAPDEFNVAVINPEMPINANIYKVHRSHVIICMDHAIGVDFSSNAFWPKVRLISLKFTWKWRLSRTGLSHASADALIDGVSAAK